MTLITGKSSALAMAACLACGLSAQQTQADETYSVVLTELNNSGVSGTGSLTLVGDDLTVQITAIGLEPDMPHPMHIHGAFDSGDNPIDSTSPTLAQDSDGDGFIEVGEGAATYGPVLVPLTMPAGGDFNDFPTAPGGTITFTETYDLTNVSTFAAGFEWADVMPLVLREIVIHGMTTTALDGVGTGGEVDGTAGYKAVLPVASGEIVPEPASAALLVLGVASTLSRKRRA